MSESTETAAAPTPAGRTESRVVRRLLVAIAVALVAAIAYQALGAAVFGPRLRSDDPAEVVAAYFDAQRWGYRGLAESILGDDERETRDAPNYVRPIVPDELFAGDLSVDGPAYIGLYGQYDEEVQFIVTYRSMWRSEIGEPPGKRLWFVYLGRDEGESWHVLGQGTGP